MTSDELTPNWQHHEKIEIAKPELKPDQLRQLFEKMDLSEIQIWRKGDQNEVQSLLTEYGFLFALNDMELGKISMVKHTIKLIDPVLFKERYR